ncbi:inducible T-cell costimulator [Pelecanus crispus]|uniref:inducible T-cell costimulator n=1 Tax=Pelecanus crispus TaxID=36300 RepID=UPI000510B0A3|nr:PREDICTED: inducible T-cell costimulator-like [Pelecanus crispus]KFQ55481.1 Inducible T-cell costimulator [Pelecanus crispus]
MKSVAVTFCVLCFQFEVLYGVDSCSPRPCKNIDQPHVSDPQVMVEFENGNFKFTFPNPKNVSEFSMTLFKGHEKKEICALHLSKEKVIPKSNVTYCQTEHSNSSTAFILKNLERKHTNIYTYCLEMFLPPPYIDCRLKETYLYIQDKEDCISLGLMSWLIIGLIMFAMIFCICCVVACCLRNKNQQCESNSHEYNSEYMPMAAVNAAKKTRI